MTGLMKHTSEQLMEQMKTDTATVNYLKSPEQGAATSVYAAVSKEWEGKGGKYLSNCEVMGPFQPENATSELGVGDDGYAEWAYNEENEDRLWRDSCKFVGVEED